MADEVNFLATDLIAANRNGYVVCRLRHVQLQFRARRTKRYAAKMVHVGLLLARRIAAPGSTERYAKHWQKFHSPRKGLDWWWHGSTGVWFFVADMTWESYTNPSDSNICWWHAGSQ